MKESIKKKIRAPTKVLGVVGLCLLSTIGLVGCSVNEEFVKQYADATKVLQNDEYVEIAKPKRAMETLTFNKSISFYYYDTDEGIDTDEYIFLNFDIKVPYIFDSSTYWTKLNTYQYRVNGIYKDLDGVNQIFQTNYTTKLFDNSLNDFNIQLQNWNRELFKCSISTRSQQIDEDEYILQVVLNIYNTEVLLFESSNTYLNISDHEDFWYVIPFENFIESIEWYNRGYEYGYRDGGDNTIDDNGLYILFESVFRAPSQMLEGMFNFEIFGINFKDIVMVIVTAAVIIFVVDILKGHPL